MKIEKLTKLSIVGLSILLMATYSSRTAWAEQELSIISPDDPRLEVLRKYNQSNPAPEYVVYRHFLRTLEVEESDSQCTTYVQRELGFPESPEGRQQASIIAGNLQYRAEYLADEIHEATREALCPNDRYRRSKEDVYEILDELVFTREHISNFHYVDALRELPKEIADELQKAMKRMQRSYESTAFTQESKSKLYKDDYDIRDHIDRICSK